MAIKHRMSAITWLWFLILLVLHQAQTLQAGDRWDSIITSLTELDGTAFRDQVAQPLVQLSGNAYRYPEVINVSGWVLSSRVAPIAPSKGGMHALVYEEEKGGANGRIVISFRGTQIAETLDSDADLCADALMWQNPYGDACGPPPYKCAMFDKATLDYYTQAVGYTLKVLGAYPSASVLLTGHSLGAGLAILVSAAVKSTYPAIPVIAFSSAGTRTALRVRNLKLDAEHEKKIVIIANQWDEIMRTTWDEQVGMLCLYNETLPTTCKRCFDSPTCIFEKASLRWSMLVGVTSANYCKLCFLTTHWLTQVINTVQKGLRPICQFHA